MTTEARVERCHDCAHTHDKCLAQQRVENELAEARMENERLWNMRTRGSFYGRRWQYHAPWGLTQWWLPRAFRGSDEYDNPSVMVIVPLLGGVVFFYGRTLERE